MKRLFTVAISLVIALTAFAQNSTIKGTILTGSVADSKTKEAEIYATIQFFSKSNPEKVIAYTITDENGAFEHSLPSKGEYILFYTNVGKKDLKIEFTLSGEDKYDFGEILVEDDIESLKAASVVAQKTLVKLDVDKITYKVEDDIDAKTSTVLDMLRKVPMVSVDGQDNITVNGSSSFKVYVDGKPNQMLSNNASTVFKFMPASSVKNIEVVTNPGARYDAEGVGGILNITSNKEQLTSTDGSIADGVYGSVGTSISTRGWGANVALNAQKGKLSTGITASLNKQNLGGTVFDSEMIQKTAEGDITTISHSSTDMKVPISLVNVSADYQINDQNVISVSAGLIGLNSKIDGTSSTTITTPFGGSFGYEGLTYSKSVSNSVTGSVDYQHTWKDNPQKNFILSYQYSGSPSVSNSRNTYNGTAMPGMDLTDRKADGKSNSSSHSIQADYITPIGQGQTLSTGTKFIYRLNSSDQTNFIWNGSDFERTDIGSLTYNYTNKIGAAYVEYSGTFGKISTKAGVRYERTWQDVEYANGQGTNFDIEYGNLVPSASLQYNISMTSNIGLTYNMRISRPGITYLNPYIDLTDPTKKSYGNTDLTTENSHNFSLVFNSFKPKVITNVSLTYNLSPDGISQYSFMDSENILNTTYGNIVKSNSLGANGFVILTPWKQTRFIINGGLSYVSLKSDKLGQSNDGLSHTVLFGIQQTIPFDIRLSANLVSAGNSVTLQGTSKGLTLLTTGLSRGFLQDKLSVSVTGIFTPNGLNIKTEGTSEGKDFFSKSSTTLPIGQISASITYSFGKNKGTAARKAKHVEIEDNQLNSQSLGQSVSSMVSQ